MPSRLLLVRHGETEWSASGRHTGRTDVPLTDTGRREADGLKGRLPLDDLALVLTSPLSRAAETAERAGLTPAVVEPDLLEWDYGVIEGRTTPDIRAERGDPEWSVWRDGCEDGETADDVGRRADRVIARALVDGDGDDVALVAHAHLLRILAARWLELPAACGQRFVLDPAGWSLLGWERETRVVDRWNVSETPRPAPLRP